MRRGCQDINSANTQEGIEETQEAGREPRQEAKTGDIVVLQEEEEMEPALPHGWEYVVDDKVKSVKKYNIYHMKINKR